MQYSVLKTLIANSAHRAGDAAFVALIPGLIDQTANELQMLYPKLKPFEQTATLVLAAGTSRGEADMITTPPDTGGVTWALVSGDGTATFSLWGEGWLYDGTSKLYQLEYYTKEKFERLILTTDATIYYDDPGLLRMRGDVPITGAPVAATFYAGELLVFPQITDQGIGKILRLDYWGTMLYTGKGDTYEDELLLKGWPVLLYGSLIKAEPYLGSEIRVDKWIGLYNAAKQNLVYHYIGVEAGG